MFVMRGWSRRKGYQLVNDTLESHYNSMLYSVNGKLVDAFQSMTLFVQQPSAFCAFEYLVNQITSNLSNNQINLDYRST